jgi:hypothetical protein
MALKFRERRGLGSVITTLIILIASVVLAAGVIFFGGSLFQTNTENEAIQVSNAHIWVSNLNSSSSVAGFVVQNTGGKVVSVQTITIRGQSVPTGSWWYNNDPAVATAANIQRELTYDHTLAAIDVTGDMSDETFTQATGPISLEQGEAMFVYLANPAGINAIDSGLAFTMNVQAGKASAVNSVSVTNG